MIDKILAQNRAKQILTNLIKGNRFPHSLLFYGPKGVGKFSTAIEIAKYFNCLNEDINLKGNDECNNCVYIDEGRHPDVFIIRPEKKKIQIDQIRDIINHINLKPFRAKYKFFIIDGAEFMNTEASNSLLKTLEEPRPGNYIFLIVNNINFILPTILSRSVKIKFEHLPDETISQILVKSYNVDKETSEKVAMLSNGSMNNAIQLLNSDSYNSIYNIIESFTKMIKQGDCLNVVEFDEIISSLSNMDSQLIEHTLELLLYYFVNLWVYNKYGISRNQIFELPYDINITQLNFNIYKKMLDEIIQTKFNILNTNANTKLILERLFLNILGNFGIR